ncbi:MAG: hypothetical protein M0Z95_10970 [Actinomycetota bacterium]|nr:hypothetical protein [Actinomycetota bacterium]
MAGLVLVVVAVCAIGLSSSATGPRSAGEYRNREPAAASRARTPTKVTLPPVIPAITPPTPTTTTTPTPTVTTPTPTTASPTVTTPTPTTASPTVTTPTPTVGPGDHGPITSPPLPPPAKGFDEGRVTAVGDSVMIDYEGILMEDIPGIVVTASVGEHWTTGLTKLQEMKAAGQLGAVVIVGLGTNGPVTSTQFNSMMAVLAGASRVVFVNNHVDRTWQDANNAVLAAGVSRYPNTVLVHWNALADEHPTWLYSTGTHLPPGGVGAQALAALVASSA